ncbi:RNA methyltransferase, TrmH family [Prevotella sp. DNF00663]|uniref:RNA methyltransferase n=1 Tax=unclassified Prevotella TaxID=2638335 RepID=UPI0005134A45|nr:MULTISPECIES: RNA methyltransferase [unclassified Prevotella]KGI60235.1 RNA methyltransferase [Prevotella sp. S7 MS 2]KXB82242.1 RNA methyltransferase, TrmH family [Prevotella sp. DNF00663]
MISKAKIKYIKSLEHKKFRKAEQVFVAEGPKVIGDMMQTTSPKIIVAVKDWFDKHHVPTDTERITVTEEELAKTSFLQHPQEVLAVFPIQPFTAMATNELTGLEIALDGVQDPGNLGTIIRIADWFGIENIYCSTDTVDAFGPKTVQATMGSLSRVTVTYGDLTSRLTSLPPTTPIYGTLLDGDNLYEQPLEPKGVIVMGNEGNGISPQIKKLINRKLFIPNFPKGRKTADSLNVAIATAIVCAEFRRR